MIKVASWSPEQPQDDFDPGCKIVHPARTRRATPNDGETPTSPRKPDHGPDATDHGPNATPDPTRTEHGPAPNARFAPHAWSPAQNIRHLRHRPECSLTTPP
ncbi:hypothetical protein GCM10027610_138850 [Dactylosporangium cerinum]